MNAFLAMLNGPEMLAILALALLIFGAKKLPEFGRGLGKGIREFKNSVQDKPEEAAEPKAVGKGE
jgi:sec-independent protein translocase protein TatA